MTLEHKIEAVLFYKAKPVAISFLAKFFGVTEEEIGNSLFDLQQSLTHRGVRLLVSDNRYH
jgi:chromosome segregation and condensation protein ScpB